MRKKITGFTAIGLIVTGCAGTGPTPVLTASGIPAVTAIQYPNVNLLINFQSAAQDAVHAKTPEAYEQFMRAGFALIYIRCGEYFDQKGSDQASNNLIKDSIAPITAVISGILSLHNYKVASNAGRDLKALALGTSSTIAVFDIYTEHFLFGAANVNSVKRHTLEEVGTHARTAMGLNPANIEEAALQIYDNQGICTPARILESTREAISVGQFDAAVTGGAGVAQSKEFLTSIGMALGLNPPTITDTEAGVLYAWTMGYARSQPQLMLVYKKLSGFPEPENPVTEANGRYESKNDYPVEKLRRVFGDLPSGAQASLEAQSKKIMADVDNKARLAMAQVDKNERWPEIAALTKNLVTDFLGEPSEYYIPPEQAGGLRRVRLKAR